MNEILHQRIEEAAFQEGSMYDTIQEKNAAYSTGMKIATFALQNQWISVEEALPPLTQESGQVYITMDKNGYTDIKARTLDGWAGPKCWCSTERITHWMPIPELPKGGEECM